MKYCLALGAGLTTVLRFIASTLSLALYEDSVFLTNIAKFECFNQVLDYISLGTLL